MFENTQKSVGKVLDAARRKLLDTGTRNRLVHVNRTNSRANSLNIVNQRTDAVFATLRIAGRRMRFKAMGKDKTGDGQDMLLALPNADLPGTADRLSDSFLETPQGPDALARRLLRLATDARTAEEEQGLNILYLAMGFLRWRESPSSDVQRESPLILLPVQLVRNERSSTYDIQCRDDDISTNLPLQERLRQDFGIHLPEVDETEDWSPSQYFAQVREVVSGKPGWSVDQDGMQLGFFSFAKLLMHRDLDPGTWPADAFAESDLLRGLLAEGFEADTPLFGADDKLDDLLDPAQIIQVIDADASQTKVIEEVRRGASLVVQGPPGTGKSQTITNLIAAAAHDGKSVLFVAEKMAALSVVHDRLVRSGLRDICLELHSRTANKKALAQELGRTLMASAKALPGTADPTRLRATRDQLNGITALLHDPLPTGDTPFRAISEIVGFIGKAAPPPCIRPEGLDKLDRTARDRAQTAITAFATALNRVGTPQNHPFKGTTALDLQPTDLSRLEGELNDCIQKIDLLLDAVLGSSQILGRTAPARLSEVPQFAEMIAQIGPIPDNAALFVSVLFDHCHRGDLDQALAAASLWRKAHGEAQKTFQPEAFGLDPRNLTESISIGLETRFSNLPPDLSAHLNDIRAARDGILGLIENATRVAGSFGLPPPQTFADMSALLGMLDWLQRHPPRANSLIRNIFNLQNPTRLIGALDLAESWHLAKRAAEARFVDAAWSVDPGPIRTAIAKGAASLWSRWFGGYRKASATLAEVLKGAAPDAPAERLTLATELVEVITKRKQLAQEEDWLRNVLADDWQGERTAFSDIKSVALWTTEGGFRDQFETPDHLLSALTKARDVQLSLNALSAELLTARQVISTYGTRLGLAGQDWSEGKFRDASPLAGLLQEIDALEKYHAACVDLQNATRLPLPPDVTARMTLANELKEVHRLRETFANQADVLHTVLAEVWQEDETPFDAVAATVVWLRRVKAGGLISSAVMARNVLDLIPNPADEKYRLLRMATACNDRIAAPLARLGLDLAKAGLGRDLESTPLTDLRAAMARMADDPSGYGDWAGLARSIGAAVVAGAKAVVDAVSEGRVDPSRTGQEFAYACAEARWSAARAARPDLNLLPQLDRHDLVTLFRDLEKDRIEAAKTLILSRHFDQMPRGTVGEMGVIKGEIGRKKGHKPIRWVMKNAGAMVQRIKPVMLMSPISVAQFLPPGTVTFDLLVIDEASQIWPEDALGVIARARQIVVVGDQKQLPPTSFFDRLVDDVEENDDDEEDTPVGATAADMESILSLCEARGLRQRMLEWHYRSRDPSLIRVSNAEFYGDGLVLPPSPLERDPDYGLKFRHIPGVYARGGSGTGRQGTNRIEAEAVVKAMADHARHWPDLSLGVVAFSKTQADMLTEVLELHRRRDPVLDGFLREGKSEDVFVKNIENVQGDERDVILISVGYGPQEAGGRLSAMTFGPVNGEGGERRLNVLFSRARVRCEVFASFDPGDIDPSRVKRDGPRVLKRFLDYAKTGIMDQRAPTGLDADSPFEEDVAAVISSLGYIADTQVGSAGFRIDIGVRHPGRPGQYLVAVECDGAAYHSALWARERDRLRQDILENLGWRFHRIWSTDWFHHRRREIERLKTALTTARDQMESGIRVRGANHASAALTVPESPVLDDVIDIGHLGLTAPAYVRAELSVRSSVEPHEAPLAQLADLVSKIVAIEGPIHIDEVARRVTTAFGKARTGSRIADAVTQAAHFALRHDTTLRQDGPFLMTTAQAEAPPVRDRSAESGNLLKAAMIAPAEIAAAAALVRQESGDAPVEELVRAVARLLGFQRVGSDLAAAIADVLTR